RSAYTKGDSMADGQDSRDLITPPGTSTPGGQAAHSIMETCAQMRETGEEMRHKAQELTAQGKEMAAACYQQGREHVHAWQQHLTDHVREHPLQSLMIAAGLGMLVGLLRRR